jgi:hypothetical protein
MVALPHLSCMGFGISNVRDAHRQNVRSARYMPCLRQGLPSYRARKSVRSLRVAWSMVTGKHARNRPSVSLSQTSPDTVSPLVAFRSEMNVSRGKSGRLWEQEAPGSNPGTPTITLLSAVTAGFLCPSASVD